LIGFCQVEAIGLCWITLGVGLCLFSISLQNRNNFLYLHGDEELARSAPPVPPSSFTEPASSSQKPYPNYGDIGETLRSIQEGQASLWAFVASKHAALRNFVQEQYDEL